jgi:hypothetical protein
MSCLEPQNLCSFFRGDTVPFDFSFKDDDDNPIDISGKTLTFTMKKKKNSIDGLDGDLQQSVTFPNDANSIAGIGSMVLLPDVTRNLLISSYYFDFQLVDGPDDVSTVGFGSVVVEQDITITTV